MFYKLRKYEACAGRYDKLGMDPNAVILWRQQDLNPPVEASRVLLLRPFCQLNRECILKIYSDVVLKRIVYYRIKLPEHVSLGNLYFACRSNNKLSDRHNVLRCHVKNRKWTNFNQFLPPRYLFTRVQRCSPLSVIVRMIDRTRHTLDSISLREMFRVWAKLSRTCLFNLLYYLII